MSFIAPCTAVTVYVFICIWPYYGSAPCFTADRKADEQSAEQSVDGQMCGQVSMLMGCSEAGCAVHSWKANTPAPKACSMLLAVSAWDFGFEIGPLACNTLSGDRVGV